MVSTIATSPYSNLLDTVRNFNSGIVSRNTVLENIQEILPTLTTYQVSHIIKLIDKDLIRVLFRKYTNINILHQIFKCSIDSCKYCIWELSHARGLKVHLTNFLIGSIEDYENNIQIDDLPFVSLLLSRSSEQCAELLFNLDIDILKRWIQFCGKMNNSIVAGKLSSVLHLVLKNTDLIYAQIRIISRITLENIFKNSIMDLCRCINQLYTEQFITNGTRAAFKQISAPGILTTVINLTSDLGQTNDDENINFELASDLLTYWTLLVRNKMNIQNNVSIVLKFITKILNSTQNNDMWLSGLELLDLLFGQAIMSQNNHTTIAALAHCCDIPIMLIKRTKLLDIHNSNDSTEMILIHNCIFSMYWEGLSWSAIMLSCIRQDKKGIAIYLERLIDVMALPTTTIMFGIYDCITEIVEICRSIIENLVNKSQQLFMIIQSIFPSICRLIVAHVSTESQRRKEIDRIIIACTQTIFVTKESYNNFISSLADQFVDLEAANSTLIHLPLDISDKVKKYLNKEVEIPEELLDPLTYLIMKNPVKIPDPNADNSFLIVDQQTIDRLEPRDINGDLDENGNWRQHPYTRSLFHLSDIKIADEIVQKLNDFNVQTSN